jgi:hypothetical protein
MAGPTVASVGTLLLYGNRTNSTFAAPSGVAQNDVLVLHLYWDDSTPTITPPSGWSELTLSPPDAIASPNVNVHIYWKRATASEPTSYTFTHGAANTQGQILRVSGCVTTGMPLEALGSAVNSASGTPTPAVSGTTSTANELLILGCFIYASTTFTAISGWTAAHNGDGQYIASKTQATAGATGSISTTAAASNAQVASVIGAIPPVVDTTPPSVPSGVTATASSPNGVTVSWTASTDDVGVASYQVKRGGTVVAAAVTGTSFADSKLTPSTLYSYTVNAVDAAGNRSADSAAATATTPAVPQPVGPSGTWQLAFNDEFDGSAIDTTKWQPYWYTDGAGSSMNGVTTSSANVSLGGSVVKLTLASTTDGALIHTDIAGGYQLPVGSYVEASVQFAGDGTSLYNWPAWWASTSDVDGWPADGENDIAEGSSSGSPGTLAVNYHAPSVNVNEANPSGYWGGSFHTYGLHRLASSCDVYWDGVKVASYATSDSGKPEILVLNIGIKSDSSGTMTGAAGAMQVDWVRAWNPTTLGASPADAEGLTDHVTAAQSFTRNPADAEHLTDQATPAQTFNRSAADHATLTDHADTAQSFSRSVADHVGLTDQVTISRSVSQQAADTLGMTDSVSVVLGFVEAPADRLGLTDHVTVQVTDTGPTHVLAVSALTDDGLRTAVPVDDGLRTAVLADDGLRTATVTAVPEVTAFIVSVEGAAVINET